MLYQLPPFAFIPSKMYLQDNTVKQSKQANKPHCGELSPGLFHADKSDGLQLELQTSLKAFRLLQKQEHSLGPEMNFAAGKAVM